MQYQRVLNLTALLEKKSFFLFGPRATGKTKLVKTQLKTSALIIDLLRGDIFLKLSKAPWKLEEIINAHQPSPRFIVVDEVQKIPMLLDEVHRLIEDKGYTFLLTGSSARKLKSGHANLLAGRAWQAEFFPLIYQEITNFKLYSYLRYGGLPSVYKSNAPDEELYAYINTYLNEEIKAEAMVRNIQGFTRFLQIAAATSGTMLNYSSLASDVGLPATTVKEYYQILEDTLVGFSLPAWTKTIKRKAVSTAKFYLFDVGVMHQLAGVTSIDPCSDRYGIAFEHFIAMELRAYLSYRRRHVKLSYWRSKHGFEVDFIIGDSIAIEVKSSENISNKHLKGLKALQEEGLFKYYFCISLDSMDRLHNDIYLLHWKTFLSRLWTDEWGIDT